MKILLFIIITLALCFVLVLLRYQITHPEIIRGTSTIKYKLIDIGQNDFFRYSFESLILKRRRVFLKTAIRNNDWIYVNLKDFSKLHPESPIKMIEKNYTITFDFQIKRLVFGGYSRAKIISIEKINEKPEVSKS